MCTMQNLHKFCNVNSYSKLPTLQNLHKCCKRYSKEKEEHGDDVQPIHESSWEPIQRASCHRTYKRQKRSCHRTYKRQKRSCHRTKNDKRLCMMSRSRRVLDASSHLYDRLCPSVGSSLSPWRSFVCAKSSHIEQDRARVCPYVCWEVGNFGSPQPLFLSITTI